MRVVSNYERAKFTRKARGANNFRLSPRFACLLIFAERVDSSCCYFPPKLKITRTLSTTVQFRKAINLAFRRGKSTAPNTQDQYPCYQDEEKQLTKGPTSFPGLSPLWEGGRENKLEKIQGPLSSQGIFHHYTSHGPHSSSITASIEAAKISLLHPTFVGV